MTDSTKEMFETRAERNGGPGLRVTDVSAGYKTRRGDRIVAAHDLNLHVEQGEFAAVIGPSGCGKSTLLSAIAGLIDPFQGQISLDGDPGESRLGKIAYMQQKDLLLPWRTVLANARLGLELTGVDRTRADDAATARAQHFGLDSVLDSYPWQLSGGMRQRAALLRATLPHSPVLLLDEPFGALDAITRRHLQQWLAGVLERANRAILLVTHDIEEALLLADRVYVMSPGPGTIIDTVEVPLSRPRTEDAVTTPEFIALKSRLMSRLSSASPTAPDMIVERAF